MKLHGKHQMKKHRPAAQKSGKSGRGRSVGSCAPLSALATAALVPEQAALAAAWAHFEAVGWDEV